MKTSIRIQLVSRCLGLALIGGALLGSQVFAAEPTDPPSIRVKYGDLNLQSPPRVLKRFTRESTVPQRMSALLPVTANFRS